jgi:hypothetical protein
MFLHHVTSYHISPISTNQTKGECMQNLLYKVEIFLMLQPEPESRNQLLRRLSGSLVISARLNGNLFRSCLFNLRKRQTKYTVI